MQCIWIDREKSQIRFFTSKKTSFLHACTTCSELQSYISSTFFTFPHFFRLRKVHSSFCPSQPRNLWQWTLPWTKKGEENWTRKKCGKKCIFWENYCPRNRNTELDKDSLMIQITSACNRHFSVTKKTCTLKRGKTTFFKPIGRIQLQKKEFRGKEKKQVSDPDCL